MGRQLDRLMPVWQPANILHSVLIFMLLQQINIVVVALIVLLIFCNVFNWCHLVTSCLTLCIADVYIFFHPQTFCLDIVSK